MKLHKNKIKSWIVKLVAILIVLFLIFAGLSFLFL